MLNLHWSCLGYVNFIKFVHFFLMLGNQWVRGLWWNTGQKGYCHVLFSGTEGTDEQSEGIWGGVLGVEGIL